MITNKFAEQYNDADNGGGDGNDFYGPNVNAT